MLHEILGVPKKGISRLASPTLQHRKTYRPKMGDVHSFLVKNSGLIKQISGQGLHLASSIFVGGSYII